MVAKILNVSLLKSEQISSAQYQSASPNKKHLETFPFVLFYINRTYGFYF